MDVRIEAVPLTKRDVLAQLLQLYIYDFTEFEPRAVGEDGTFSYRYLDEYWAPVAGEERHPFFIRAGEELAGFAMVRVVNGSRVMAEFFVLRKHRGQGVGAKAARLVFSALRGDWIVHEHPANKPAQRFWSQVIRAVTGGDFEETVGEDGAWTQRFTT